MSTLGLGFVDLADGVSLLRCPLCADTNTHVDDVYVLGRPREDGDIVAVHVDHRGSVDRTANGPTPAGGAGRRHTFSIAGWCEGCASRFAISFRQHKGQTLVSLSSNEWVPSGAAPTSEGSLAVFEEADLDRTWVETELPDQPTSIVRAGAIDAIRLDLEATPKVMVLVGGAWQELAAGDYTEMDYMAESLTSLLMDPSTEPSTYRWHGSAISPTIEPLDWDWQPVPTPFGPS